MKSKYYCSICNYETELSYKGNDLFDKDGNRINFRRACPNCGYIPRLTSLEINTIIANSK